MSSNRSESKSKEETYILDSYRDVAIEFFPGELGPGHCYGHAQLGKNAVLSGHWNKFKDRPNHFFYGVPKNSKSSERISLDDLNELIKKLELTSYMDKEDPELDHEAEKKEIQKIREEKKSEMQSAFDALIKTEAFDALVKTIKLTDKAEQKETKEEVKEHKSDVKPQHSEQKEAKREVKEEQNDAKAEKLEPSELKEQTSLAWDIRKAFLAKTRANLIKKAKENKVALTEEAIRSRLKSQCARFDKRYPFIWELIQLSIYLENLVVIHKTSKFTQLLEEKDRSFHQDIERVKRLVMPVALDSKEEKGKFNDECLDVISTMFSLDSLNVWLTSLSSILEKEEKQFAQNKLQPVLPLVLTLMTGNHQIALAYQHTTREWILINSNKGLKQQAIAKEVFEAFAALCTYTFYGKNTIVKLGFMGIVKVISW